MMAQLRTPGTAPDYVTAPSRYARANCRELAEAAEHDRLHRTQALISGSRWSP